MHTVAIAGHKGGIGKTTLSIVLAHRAILDKKRVAVVDLDPQQSLLQWWEQRPESDPLRVVTLKSHDQLGKAKKLLDKDFDLVIIDTPPAHQDIIKAAIQESDITIIPCRPSPVDIRGIGETVTLLEMLKKPFFFVLNQVNDRTKIANDALLLLSQYGKIAPVPLGMRVDYAQGTLDGKTPLDTRNKQIIIEVNQLYTYLVQQIGKL